MNPHCIRVSEAEFEAMLERERQQRAPWARLITLLQWLWIEVKWNLTWHLKLRNGLSVSYRGGRAKVIRDAVKGIWLRARS